MKRAFAIAITLYVTLTFALFAPQLAGETLQQSDIIQYRGMAQEIFQTREALGEDPQWSGALFGGMPAYFINVKYPAQILKSFTSWLFETIIGSPASMIILAMLSMWLMLVLMRIDPYVAIVGGAMYGLSTYFFIIIGVGHITKMWALLYAPAMIGAIYATLKAERAQILLPAALTALFASLQIAANHPQITYYFLFAALFIWSAEAIKAFKSSDRAAQLKRFAQRTAILAAAAVVAILSNLSPLYYTLQHSGDTMRGGSELMERTPVANKGLDIEYATAWSYGRAETINLLIPDFMGRDSATPFAIDGPVAETLRPYGAEYIAQQLPTYWGTQPFTAGSTYLGAVTLFLAVLGVIVASRRQRRWIVSLTILMILLAWGSNMLWLTELFFKVVPLYNKFRTVSMALVVVEWTVPLLAAIALHHIWSGSREDEKMKVAAKQVTTRQVAIAAAATAGVAALLALGGAALLFDFGYADAVALLLGAEFPRELAYSVADAMAAEREAIMASDGWRTVIYIAIAAAAVVAHIKGHLRRWAMLTVVGAAAVLDMTGVATRYLSHEHFGPESRNRIAATEANRAIKQDRGVSGNAEYRVLNLTLNPFNDASTSYHHRSVGGYHGAKLARYQDMIDYYLHDAEPEILDMLNTKYLIVPSADGRTREVVQRTTALGAAWFVDQIEVVETPLQAIESLAQIELATTAVVEQGTKGYEPLPSTSAEHRAEAQQRDTIVMEEYLPHYQRYSYSAAAPRTAIFSEIYYDKGWRAFIDGQQVPYFRADYILRAMNLPAGEHTVEWRFKAPHWRLIESITLLASLAILAALLLAAYRAMLAARARKKSKCNDCVGNSKCRKCKRLELEQQETEQENKKNK